MVKSTSRSSVDELNKKLKSLLTDNKLLDGLIDARICNDIAIDLYTLRAQSGITQKELAEKLGVKQSNISRWEHPGYQGYKVKMLSKIVRTLGGKLELAIFKPAGNMLTHINYVDNMPSVSVSSNTKTTSHDQLKDLLIVDQTKGVKVS